MSTQDRADLNDLLRLLDAPPRPLAGRGARLRWTSPTALALDPGPVDHAGGPPALPVGGRPQRSWRPRPWPTTWRCSCPRPGSPTSPASRPSPAASPARRGWSLKDRLATLIGLLEHRVQVLVTGPLAALERLPHPTWFEKAEAGAAPGLGGAPGAAAGDPGGPGLPAHRPGRRARASSAPAAWWWTSGRTTWKARCAWSSSATSWSGSAPSTPTASAAPARPWPASPSTPASRATGATARRCCGRVAAARRAPPSPRTTWPSAASRLATHGHFPGEELFYPAAGPARGASWPTGCRPACGCVWSPSGPRPSRDRERARIQDSLAVLRRGGVVCPAVRGPLPGPGPQPHHPHSSPSGSREATVPLQAQPAREFQGRLGELAEYLQELALTGPPGVPGRLHPGHARPLQGDPPGIRAAGGLRHPGRLPQRPPAPVRGRPS